MRVQSIVKEVSSNRANVPGGCALALLPYESISEGSEVVGVAVPRGSTDCFGSHSVSSRRFLWCLPVAVRQRMELTSVVNVSSNRSNMVDACVLPASLRVLTGDFAVAGVHC